MHGGTVKFNGIYSVTFNILPLLVA